MFYALTGIPLNLVMFQSIGERLNKIITVLLRHIKKCLHFKDVEVSQTNLIIVTLNMSSIVLAGGAALFSHYEGWPYLDSLYYCFITLTTIGFGDYVALQQNGALQKQPEYVVFSLIFILAGLAVLSACMNLLVLRFLTMNTTDERREQLEAAAAALYAVHLDGDVITGNCTWQPPSPPPTCDDNVTSVCGCVCCDFLSNRRLKKKIKRYTVRRSPGPITHLLPAQGSNDNRHSVLLDSSKFTLNIPQQHRLRRYSM